MKLASERKAKFLNFQATKKSYSSPVYNHISLKSPSTQSKVPVRPPLVPKPPENSFRACIPS